MLNREKYAKEIVDIAVNGKTFAVKDGRPVSEALTSCDECGLYHYGNCSEARKEWANSEYVEPSVDWTIVAVNTPILARDYEEGEWKKRYFAKYENGIVYAWNHGTTSWSACGSSDISAWKMAKLVESEE